MKKFTLKNICKVFVVFAFMAMTAVTTSCTQDAFDHAVEKTAKSFGEHVDFINAVNAIIDNSDWNKREQCFEKYQGSRKDATSTLRRYTNARMDIPGSWYIDDTNYIIVRPSANSADIYDIIIEADHIDENGRTSGHESIKAYFMYDKILNH